MGARCLRCGSLRLTRFITIQDSIQLSVAEHLTLKCKDPSLPSKRKVRREVRAGRRLEGSGSDRFVHEVRIVDAAQVGPASSGTQGERIPMALCRRRSRVPLLAGPE